MAYTDPMKRDADVLDEGPSAKKPKYMEYELGPSLVMSDTFGLYVEADGKDWFKLRFYKAIAQFGIDAIINWRDPAIDNPHASMLHAAILGSDYENFWAVHQLIDMGADVERRGRVWFTGFDLNPLELCAYLLGHTLSRSENYLGSPASDRGHVDSIISKYCEVIDHLIQAGAPADQVSSPNWVVAGLRLLSPDASGEISWGDEPDPDSDEALMEKVLNQNRDFRITFDLPDVWEVGASWQKEARAAAREKSEVESEVAAAMKKLEMETQFLSEEELFGEMRR
jgi:hypothetical protein